MTAPSRPADLFRAGSAIRIVVATAAAYLVGSWIGLQLRLPPAIPSVIWPPNATVTAILLFVPVRRWWCVLLGAACAHFAIQLPMWPPALVAGLFLTNCSEALIGAAGVRYLSDRPSSLNTLRRVAIFIVMSGLLAPFVSSFLDAAVVTLVNREDYWTVWKLRFFSNVLAQLAIVPAIAGLLNTGRAVLRWPLRSWLEAAAVGAGLIAVATAVAFDVGHVGLTSAPLSPFLPLLLWAAVRFGSAGVGVSLLGMALLAVIGALYGDGLFPMVPPDARIRTLQIFLISAAVPLLCVGALVEERRKTATALQVSDALKSTILTSIPSLVAVIDRNGRIVTVNESWQSARQDGVMSEFSGEPDASYLDVWAAAATGGSATARAGFDGIKSVLDGDAPGYSLEYCSDGRGDTAWWMMSVVPLKRPEGGAVITHTNITARKRAEMEAQQSRDELSHAGRVWVMGELTASLSHQLGQPLTGITANALAGHRFLDTNPPNVAEVHEILSDIEADAQRASEVTRAIREMLAKDVAADELLDINGVVRDTLTLVSSEASTKGVTQLLQLAPQLRFVRGKRVQLRQLVLNLAMNAIEAMDGADPRTGSRVLTVRSEPVGTTHVQVSLLDTGCGLPEGAEEQIFEPLFTTKPSGMGMGLPIARTIVQAHGGTISADHRDVGGAIFRFTLPVSVEQPSRDPV